MDSTLKLVRTIFSSPLSRQYLSWIFIFGTTLSLVVTTAEIYSHYVRLHNDLDGNLERISSTYIDALGNSLWEYHDAQAQLIMDGITLDSRVRAVEVKDGTLNLVSGDVPTDTSSRQVQKPISISDFNAINTLGTFVVYADLNWLHSEIYNFAIARLLNNLTKSIGLILFSFIAFWLLVKRHLEAISAFLSANRKLTASATSLIIVRQSFAYRGADEIDDVVTAINELGQEIRDHIRTKDQQLNVLDEALQSAKQSLIYADNVGNIIFSKLSMKDSTCLPGVMKVAVTSPLRLRGCFVQHGLAVNELPYQLVNCSTAVEVSLPDGTIWELFVFQLKLGGNCVICTDITARRAIEEQVSQLQKMESLGVMAGGIAHEFNNLLAVINGNLEYLNLSANFSRGHQTNIDMALESSMKASNITQSLLTFSRKETTSGSGFVASAAVRELVPILRSSYPAGIDLIVNVTGEKSIFVDRGLFDSAILNMAVNARDAVDEARGSFDQNGAVEIRVRDVYESELRKSGVLSAEAGILVEVLDNGPGVPPEIGEQIFAPFFTTKSTSGGTGLGLSMACSFVGCSKGTLTYRRTADGRSCFSMMLPCHVQAVSAVKKLPKATRKPHGASGNLLLVEDNEFLLNILSESLRYIGYSVMGCHGVREADLVVSQQTSVDLIIADFSLPDGNGSDVVDVVKNAGLEIPIIFASGDINNPLLAKAALEHLVIDVLSKPIGLGNLQQAISRGLSNLRLGGCDVVA